MAGRAQWLTLGKGTGVGRRLTSYSLSFSVITCHFHLRSAFLSPFKKMSMHVQWPLLRTYPLESKTPSCGWTAGRAGSGRWAGARATARWRTWRSAAWRWPAWTGAGGLRLSGGLLGRDGSNAFRLAGPPRGPNQVDRPGGWLSKARDQKDTQGARSAMPRMP